MGKLRALVVGGGIAGMAFAIAARRHGHDVDLIELDPRVVGVGIFLNGSTLYALESIGLADACVRAGFPADAILYLDGAGNRLDEKPFPKVASPHLPRSAGIQRRKLAHILGTAAKEAGANIALGLTIDAIEEDDAGVVATLSDGTQKRYDLIVAADGIYSKVRQLVFARTPTATRPDPDAAPDPLHGRELPSARHPANGCSGWWNADRGADDRGAARTRHAHDDARATCPRPACRRPP